MAVGALLADRSSDTLYGRTANHSSDRSGSAMFERLLTAGQEVEEKNPYFALADENGIIDYRGTIFVCDKKTNSLCLGDCTDRSKCIQIGLSGGGSLIVNRDNLNELFNAISMFSPEDVNRILQAIQKDKIAQEASLAAEDEADELYEKEKYSAEIQEKIQEIYQKLATGDTEEKFPIGAQLFGITEWDKFLERFDKTEEEVKKAQEEELEQRVEDAKKKELLLETQKDSEHPATEEELALLTAESTKCTYPSGDAEVTYITWYTSDGIYCRKAGQTEGYEWSVLFEDAKQYEKVMELLGSVPEDTDWRFAAREDFWKNFLNGKMEENQA